MARQRCALSSGFNGLISYATLLCTNLAQQQQQMELSACRSGCNAEHLKTASMGEELRTPLECVMAALCRS